MPHHFSSGRKRMGNFVPLWIIDPSTPGRCEILTHFPSSAPYSNSYKGRKSSPSLTFAGDTTTFASEKRTSGQLLLKHPLACSNHA